ncbi:hypothetical protein L1049_023389 [Liquidambar formosana]|uniref:Uncharacterized protein n=1 Tax=Liquidambar formosana TaxID=63359 RepID=A0AAP0RT05_LIQFO
MFSSLKYLTFGSRLKHSLVSFPSLHTKFHCPSRQTFHLLLEKCSSMAELKLLHAQIILHGLALENLTIGKLISFCAVDDAGDLQYAQLVFDQIPEPNKFMYNSLIRGYANSNDPKMAILLFRRLVGSGLSPNEFTLPFVLKACACKLLYWEAVVVHGQAIRLGIGSQVCVQNAVINVFVVCGLVRHARQMFDDICDKTLVSWNSMIGGYSRMGCCKEAFLLFQEMRGWGVEPDVFTFVNLLSACTQTCDFNLGRYVHCQIEITGAKTDIYVQNALVDMYAKCGYLHLARIFFDRMPYKNVVSWTSMVSAYANLGLVEFAQPIFDQTPMKNVVSWNSMISCYIGPGRCREALDLFLKMCDTRVIPDEATLGTVLSACGQLGLLSACSHSGLVDAGLHYFDQMRFIYRISCEVEHYACMVDLLGRGGLLEEAIKLIGGMPMKPDVVVWGALLGACRTHGNVEIGKMILKQLLEFEPYSAGLYVLISNIYSEAERWEDVKKIRKLMKDHGIKKFKAISLIEIDGCVCEFLVDDKRHNRSRGIYSMLDQLTDHLKSVGYFCNLSSACMEEMIINRD